MKGAQNQVYMGSTLVRVRVTTMKTERADFTVVRACSCLLGARLLGDFDSFAAKHKETHHLPHCDVFASFLPSF